MKNKEKTTTDKRFAEM